MKKTILFLSIISLITLQFCTSTKKAVIDKNAPLLSWEKDISPIMQQRCTPCHYPETGKKKFLDTYAATKENIDSILYRVQLPRDHPKFMPFKSKKEPLSDSLIQIFILWKAQNMPA